MATKNTLLTTKQGPEIWVAFNPATRKMQEVFLDELEILEGEKLIRMFWCQAASAYLTIPGAAFYKVDGELNLEPCND